MNNDKPAYTCQEAAQIIGCDRRRLTRPLLAGDIPALRFGRDWRISADVVHALARGEPTPALERLTVAWRSPGVRP